MDNLKLSPLDLIYFLNYRSSQHLIAYKPPLYKLYFQDMGLFTKKDLLEIIFSNESLGLPTTQYTLF